MAKSQFNPKSKEYLNDRDTFHRELKQFNESKGTTLKHPVVSGVEIDLFLFFTLVQQRGGLHKVNQQDAWDTFLRPLKLPHPCINGTAILKKLYALHLEKFEKAKGPPGRDDDNDLDDDFRTRTRGGGAPRASHGGAYISASGETIRTGAPKAIAGHSERLALSLLSPMPNEQDFAVNVCTVLAADFSNRLPLGSTPHILDFLLAHAGVYNHSSLRDTIGRSYYEARGRYPDEFWKLSAGGGGVRELVDEKKFMSPGLEEPELIVQAMAAHNTLTDALAKGHEEVIDGIFEEDYPDDWVTEPSEEDTLFAPTLPGGAKCVYTQRVLQIASIVRSLSFHEDNLTHLARSATLIRFLLLCANCWVGTLRQSGLDTLGNICAELIIKEPATCLISRHVLSTIHSCMTSNDRARILSGLEMLNKLSQNEANEDVLLKHVDPKVYIEVGALVCVRDIMVVVCALECVCALTELGPRAADLLLRAPRLLHTLIALLTVEAQSYGPKACILMRVVETVSGAPPTQEQTDKQQVQPQTTQPQPVAPPAPPVQSVPAPKPPVETTTMAPPAAVAPPVNNLQQQHLQQKTVQENEQFALAWLRASFVPLPPSDNSGVIAADLYRQYVATSTKLGRKGVIAPNHFPRLVRTVFGGTVGPNTVTISTGETQQVYIGIKSKKINQQPGPASPILKAQLTTKPDGKPVVVQQLPVAQPSPSHPHLSQALETPTSNTSLIKHLLANKVSQPPQTMPVQVAQRQQNQQKLIANSANITTQNHTMEIDPEALIKCTTILPGGGASNMPSVIVNEKMVVSQMDDSVVPKEEPVQIQIDEQQQVTIKTSQNKMLADLLEKKSNPPVQVVQMAPQSHHPPTIQITETGQIVQVKSDHNPVMHINTEQQLIQQSGAFYQIKNEQGQVIQLKNEQGQIIHLKSEQQVGQIVQGVIKTEDMKSVVVEHTFGAEPPSKKVKIEERKESNPPRESVSKTAANLYAALAASLQDDDDMLAPKQEPETTMPQSVIVTTNADSTPVLIQEPILQVQQPALQMQQTMQVQQQPMQVQQPTMQVPQQNIQMQQPVFHMQPMDMQNIMVSQPGQIIIQEKPLTTQTTHFVQQPMQIISTAGSSQGGISYLTPNNMMQKTIIIVQSSAGGGPITLTVNNPGGLDEATLNSVIAQATEAITQQQLIQNSGVIQSNQRVIVSQPTLVSTSQLTMVKAAMAQNAPQLTASQQPIITTQPQPHKAQIVNQQPQQIVVAQKQHSNVATILNGNQLMQQNQLVQQTQQIINGSQQVIAMSNNQQILVNTPLKAGVHRVVQHSRPAGETKTVIQSTSNTSQQKPAVPPGMRQVVTRQPIIVGGNKIGEKELIVNQPIVEPVKPVIPKQSTTATPSTSTPSATQSHGDNPWICHWKGCGKPFASAQLVFGHVASVHCPKSAVGEAPCLWLDCDRLPRKTFALLNHINDTHCTPEALKAVFASRRHLIAENESSKPSSVTYPPNAAMAALNKHAVDFLNPRELMDENEGPVTKSIRLTAALILRNIVIYSNTGRRYLKAYESHLSTIALSNVEASRTIAQVLYDLNNI